MLVKNFKDLASYQNAHESYLRQRRLTGNTSWLMLWGFGVSAVISSSSSSSSSGDFYGGNFGSAAAGFWGIVAVWLLPVCTSFSIAGIN